MNTTLVHSAEDMLAAQRLSESGAWTELLDFALEWQQRSREDYHAFYYLALAHSELGQFMQADTAFRRALALNDSDAKVWIDFGELLYKDLKRTKEGIHCMEKALSLDPANKLGWVNLATMVGKLGHHYHAMTFADRALALDPELVEAYLHKGAAARALGKQEVLREVCGALGAIPPEKFQRAG